MGTNNLDLVMTPDGIKQQVITPDDEMPDVITYQGITYVRPVECAPRLYINEYATPWEPRRSRWECGNCGFTLSIGKPNDGQICPKCHAKVVNA